MGKVEGKRRDWHGHVTAITVAPEFRNLGAAREMMAAFEAACEQLSAYFVDLFVRPSNGVAIGMYKNFGYSVYRRVCNYYWAAVGKSEDAFDMRKPLSRDTEKKSIRKNGESYLCDPEDIVF